MSDIGNPYATDMSSISRTNAGVVQSVATINNLPATNSAGVPILQSTLDSVVPPNIAASANAFAVSLLQVKNIEKMNVEKFAQIIPNLETTKDLAIGGTNVPTDTTAATAALALIANGSGPDGTYQMSDFFGAMSGTPYQCANTQSTINQLDTSALDTIYDSMITLLSGAGPYNASLQTLITNAETAILNISTSNPALATTLNNLWSSLGTQLTIELNARIAALPSADTVYTSPATPTATAFVDMIPTFAVQTEPNQAAQTLEKIANTTNVYGQSIVGMMREARNTVRLGLAGGELDNNIPSTLPQTEQNGLGIPKVTGAPTTLGSLAGSPYQNLVPPSLDVFNTTPAITPSIYTPAEASVEVDLCNCDCWQT